MILTERLILRPPQPADRAAIHAMWADPVAMADLGPVNTAEQTDAALARHASYGPDLGYRAVVRRVDDAVVGFCGLKIAGDDTPVAGELECGWMIARAHWRRGYALEAMAALLDWGWANTAAPRIVAITAQRNAKSRGMMERLGMTHRPALDFVHPRFASDDPLAPAVIYVLDRQQPALG
ncbi:GNAT family N-acetyltransferase [Sphingomonas sp. Mn802worker]|uniref:GNAT family N-acetyltransferase n=1 Tax=Sphingomonas sp. Mn802worker TaxID=629773 RepID=UPI0003A64ED5|nr:GNAT family N-acetyltransferase [Sphingomonas sp. Mn802worker]